jgi:hypothetical protein
LKNFASVPVIQIFLCSGSFVGTGTVTMARAELTEMIKVIGVTDTVKKEEDQ